MKNIEQHFVDWEAHVFGYGYGTGEYHVLRALRMFMRVVRPDGSYGYEALEKVLAPEVTWLLINTLCHAGMIDYGTSSRHGWLTGSGKALRDFMVPRELDNLYGLTSREEGYAECFPDHCNCGDGDCRPTNPFWRKRNT